ncbi:hypothetical protein E0G74_01135 [Salmonella enterica]|nr:hypothetical protein [Salmonella enterica]EGD6457266.1 hypothetical protein [Salmonella enterica]
MSVSAIPSTRQLRIVADKATGEIYLCRTSHKDRSRVLEKHEVTADVLVAAVQHLCHGDGRDSPSVSTVCMPSGNYRIYIREISDVEAAKDLEKHRQDKAKYGEE